MDHLNDYEVKLLEGWEDVFKRGSLTLWTLLALKDGPKHMAQIKDFISGITKEVVTADDQSMYRGLRRYYDAELVRFETVASESGPDLKYYSLTKTGEVVLRAFVGRNIRIFSDNKLKGLLGNDIPYGL